LSIKQLILKVRLQLYGNGIAVLPGAKQLIYGKLRRDGSGCSATLKRVAR
jgi:hypothetical protein